jgi:aminoglycoside 3-N-acetyltransferase
MGMKDQIREMTPQWALDSFRKFKKDKRNRSLEKKRRKGQVIDEKTLLANLQRLSILPGDSVLVHCAMSKIGALENGPATLVNALMQAVGPEGHILMPTSPNPQMQLDYIRELDIFDVQNSPSKMGAVSEYFRKLPGVERSCSPTEPISVWGPEAKWFTEGHFGKTTPYDADSPFRRLVEKKGKILYIGVTLINAGTSLHTLEDAVDDFLLPVYYPETFPVKVKTADGNIHSWEVKVHNPEVSVQRKCDDLLPIFHRVGAARLNQLGEASTWVFDAKRMFEVMMKEYQEFGVTMYDAKGRGK